MTYNTIVNEQMERTYTGDLFESHGTLTREPMPVQLVGEPPVAPTVRVRVNHELKYGKWTYETTVEYEGPYTNPDLMREAIRAEVQAIDEIGRIEALRRTAEDEAV